MSREEPGDLAESFLRLRYEGIEELGVALAFENLQHRFDSRLPQLAMRPDGIAEKQIARPRGEDSRRKIREITEERRDQRIAQITPGRIKRRRSTQPS